VIELINYLQAMNPYVYLALLAFILPTYLYLTRNFYLNIFDPVAMYIVMNSFAICLVMYMFIFDEIGYKSFSIFLLNNVFFWTGYAVIFVRYKTLYDQRLIKILNSVRSNESYVGIVLLTIVTVAVSILLFLSRGVPVLSENPSDAKILLYEGGFGPVRYIHMNFIPIIVGLSAIGIVLCFASCKKPSLLQRGNFRYIIIFTIVSLLLVAMGSKGSLLSITTFLSVGLYYLKINNMKQIYDKFIYITYVAFASAVAYLILIAFLTTGSSYDILSHIIVRFVASGDVFLYYYKYNLSDYYVNHGLKDFLLYIINPVASILRVAEPDFPMGAEILHYATGWAITSFGPNAQFPVIGDIFFGPAFSWLYSLTLGMLTGYLRIGSVKYLMRFGSYGTVLYLFLWSTSITIPGDLILFIQLTFMFILFSIPVYICTHIVASLSISRKQKHTSKNINCLLSEANYVEIE